MTGTDGAEARESGRSGDRPRDGVKDRGRGLLVPALVFLVLAVAVAVAGWAIFARQAADMRDESASSLQAVHNIQSTQISLWFQDELSDARLLAAAPGLVEPLKRFMDEPAGSLPPAELRDEIELYRRGHGIAAISVFDDRGQLILTAPFEQGADPAHVPTPTGGGGGRRGAAPGRRGLLRRVSRSRRLRADGPRGAAARLDSGAGGGDRRHRGPPRRGGHPVPDAGVLAGLDADGRERRRRGGG